MFEAWFSFISPNKRKKREERYFKKVYPFGSAQKLWEERRLNELFPNTKDIKLYMYHLLVLKEKMANTLVPQDDDDYLDLSVDEIIKKWSKDILVKDLGDEAIEKLIKLALTEFESGSLEELIKM